MDDVIVFSKSLPDHIEHIRSVLRRFQEKGLKLRIGKCKFFQKRVKYLGRIVSEEGYKMDDESVEAVRALKDIKPSTIKEIRQLLGLVGYH